MPAVVEDSPVAWFSRPRKLGGSVPGLGFLFRLVEGRLLGGWLFGVWLLGGWLFGGWLLGDRLHAARHLGDRLSRGWLSGGGPLEDRHYRGGLFGGRLGDGLLADQSAEDQARVSGPPHVASYGRAQSRSLGCLSEGLVKLPLHLALRKV